MPAEPAVLRWTGRALEPVSAETAEPASAGGPPAASSSHAEGPPAALPSRAGGAVLTTGSVLAADSWLVDEGQVLALDAHRDRFLAAVGGRADAAPFWHAAVAALPDEDAWFPRVELLRRPDGWEELRLLLRPAPPRGRELVVATHLGTDPRTQPTVKGPDLEALGAVRAAAAERGAGEGVILSPDGEIVEGAWSALVWWSGERMRVVDPALPRIRSVTEHALLAVAAELGVEVAPTRSSPAQLDGAELWVLSALHGPRLATAWVEGPALTSLPGRLEAWRERIDTRREPLG